LRPEIECEFNRPILGRFWLLVNFPRFVKKANIEVVMNCPKYSKLKVIPVKTYRFLCVPKIKVVKRLE